MEIKELHIRKSLLVVINYFIGIEVISLISFLVPETLFDFENLYNKLNFSTVLTYEILYLLIILLITLVPLILIIIYWFRTFYTVTEDGITSHKIFSDEDLSISSIKKIEVKQNIVQKLFNTGDVKINIKDTNSIVLKDIYDPIYYSNLVEQFFDSNNLPDYKSLDITSLIKQEENKNLEFKSTLCWDLKRKTTNKDITRAVIKTIAAFMNSDGGTLVIGVSDNREIIGLDFDMATLKRKDVDGFQNFLVLLFNDYIGVEYSNYIDIQISEVAKKFICIVKVKPADSPIYVKNHKDEEFFVRVGNATYPLGIKAVTQYIETHFNKHE